MRGARGQRPVWPYHLNPASLQGSGLLAWWPCGADDGYRTRLRDLIYGNTLTHSRDQADVGIFAATSPPGIRKIFQSGASSPADNLSPNSTIALGATSLQISLWFSQGVSNGLLESLSGTGVGGLVAGDNTDFAPRLYYRSGDITFDGVKSGTGSAGARGTFPNTAGTCYHLVATYIRDTSIATYGGTWSVAIDGVVLATNNLSGGTGFTGSFNNGINRLARIYETTNSSSMFLADIRISTNPKPAWLLYDAATRWDLYAVPTRRYFIPTNVIPINVGHRPYPFRPGVPR